MLSTASFLKQLLQEKMLGFNPLPKQATRKPVTPEGYRSTQQGFSISPAKNHAELGYVSISSSHVNPQKSL